MSIFNRIGAFCASCWRLIAGPRRSQEFTCGDCLKSQSCGLPPSDQCVTRAAQLAEARKPPLF